MPPNCSVGGMVCMWPAGSTYSGNTGIPGMEGHGTVRKYRSGFPDTVTEIPARDQSLETEDYSVAAAVTL